MHLGGSTSRGGPSEGVPQGYFSVASKEILTCQDPPAMSLIVCGGSTPRKGDHGSTPWWAINDGNGDVRSLNIDQMPMYLSFLPLANKLGRFFLNLEMSCWVKICDPITVPSNM